MSVRASTESKIDVSLEPCKIRECVMLTVVEHGTHVLNRDLICLSYANTRGVQHNDGHKQGKDMEGSGMWMAHVFSGSTIISDC